MSISNFYTIIDVNFKFSTRPKSETIIPRYQNYERMAIQTKILNAGSEKSTKIRVRGQIHVKNVENPINIPRINYLALEIGQISVQERK